MNELIFLKQPKGVRKVELSYYEYLKDAGTYKARCRVVQCLKEKDWNVKETARIMKTIRPTVRKIRDLYRKHGWKGLEDGRNGPRNPANKIDPTWEEEIKTYYQEGSIKTVSSFRSFFNRIHDTTFSYKVFWRVTKPLRQKQKKSRKKKHKRKAYWREKWQGQPFLHWQVDPKYLNDLEYFTPQMYQYNLPPYQLGFRDVVSGSTLWFYSYSLAKNVQENAIAHFMSHLAKWGIPIEKVEVQTDNDGAMVNCGTKLSGFSQIIERVFQGTHTQIPTGACWKQGYIESFNYLCEQMFYEVEDFKNIKEFIEKAYTWQLTYNLIRESPALGGKTPYQVAKKTYPQLKPEFFSGLPPIVYNGDEPSPRIEEDLKGGYHLQVEPTIFTLLSIFLRCSLFPLILGFSCILS